VLSLYAQQSTLSGGKFLGRFLAGRALYPGSPALISLVLMNSDAPKGSTARSGISAGGGDGPADGGRYCLVLILAVCVLHIALRAYVMRDVPLINPDEPRYAEAGRRMYETGRYLIPEFNGLPRYNKPPFFYWLVALGNALLGPNEMAARAPSILAGAAMLLFAGWLGWRLFGARAGIASALILSAAPLFFAVSRAAVTDATLSALATAALCVFFAGYAGWIPKSATVPAFGALCGLGFLTKGPPALVPAAVAAVFLIWERNAAFLKRARAWLAALLFLLIALPWYLALWAKLGSDEFFRMVRFEILGRLEGEVHAEPAYYFLLVVLGTFFPWSLGLPGAVWAAARRVVGGRGTGALTQDAPAGDAPAGNGPAAGSPAAEIPDMAEAGKRAAGERQAARLDADIVRAGTRFLLCWAVVGLAVFSTFKAKLATYILPIYPALAILVAAHWTGALAAPAEASPRPGWPAAQTFSRRLFHIRPDLLPGPVLLLALAAVGLAAPGWVFLSRVAASIELEDPGVVLVAAGALFAVPFILAALGRGVAAAALGAAILVAFQLDVAPYVGPMLEHRSSRSLCRQIAENLDGRKVPKCLRYRTDVEGAAYYLRARIEKLSADGTEGAGWAPEDSIEKLLAPEAPPVLCFLPVRRFDKLLSARLNRAREIARDGRTVVVTNLPP
ncbi:MAG: glycosyltransferase family 39 protein, partial [Planctomycetota bacterium]|nr:glycosyltransferase family 39 protein [Planctomycetota bacterium]